MKWLIEFPNYVFPMILFRMNKAMNFIKILKHSVLISLICVFLFACKAKELTIELDIPVIPVIKDGMFFSGLTNVENVFLGSPSLKRIAATSIILS